MKRIVRLLSLIVATCFCAQPLFAKSLLAGNMNVVEINKFQLVGAEYWPFVGNDPFRYPNDVLWGFYPESASNEAVKCAEASHKALIDFFHANWRIMRDVVGFGATRKFYLWTNDYSSASNGRTLRKPRMWHWNTGPRDYSQGYWKWESTLRPDGSCETPNADQITRELIEAVGIISQ